MLIKYGSEGIKLYQLKGGGYHHSKRKSIFNVDWKIKESSGGKAKSRSKARRLPIRTEHVADRVPL